MDLSDVSHFAGSGSELTEGIMQSLGKSNKLVDISVNYTKFGVTGLKRIPNTQSLRRLNLNGLRIEDRHLLDLGRRDNLQAFWLGGTQVTGRGVEYVIERFPNLKSVRLYNLSRLEIKDVINWFCS